MGHCRTVHTHKVSLQWSSVYIPSCRFSSSVMSRQLHDDHDLLDSA